MWNNRNVFAKGEYFSNSLNGLFFSIFCNMFQWYVSQEIIKHRVYDTCGSTLVIFFNDYKKLCIGHGEGEGVEAMVPPLFWKVKIFYAHEIYFLLIFLSISGSTPYSFYVKSFYAHFRHYSKQSLLSYSPQMRVDTIFHALTTIYSRNMSDKRVILSF